MGNRAALIIQENAGLDVVRRGRHFVEFALPDGRKRHVVTIEPLHTRMTGVEIDTTWVPSTDPAWQWQLAQADFQAHARDVFNAGDLLRWTHESGEWVIVDPQSINWINQDNSRQQIAVKQAVTGVPDDMTLRFEGAYGAGRHFEYTAHPRRLIKRFILDAPLPTPTVTGTVWFEVEWVLKNSTGVELYLGGVRWDRRNNVRYRTSDRIEFKTSDNAEPLWYADAPTATDANGETIGAQYEVRRQGGSYFITVRVPREWMEGATYPVTVDPTFTDGYGGDVQTYKDTYVSFFATGDNYGATTLLACYRNNFKSLLEFDLSSIDGAAACDSATLYLYGANQVAAEEWTAYVWSVASGNDGWPEGTKDNAAGGAGDCCWDYYDQEPGSETPWAGSAGLSTETTDYESPSIGTFTGNRSDAVGTEYQVSLTTSRVEGWFGSPNTNYGVMLWPNSETIRTQGFCSSDHTTVAYRPVLVVEYTEAGGALVKVAAETLGLNVATMRRAWSARPGAEAVGATDAPVRRGRSLRGLAETVGLGEVLARLGRSVRAGAESLGVGEALSRLARSIRQWAETVSVGDAPTRRARMLRVVSEAVSLADAGVRWVSGALVKLLSEAVGVADAWLKREWSIRTLLETVGLSDALGRSAAFAKALAETVGLTAAWTRTAGFVRQLAEAVGVGEGFVRKAVSAFVKLMSETVGVVGAAVRRAWGIRSVAETVALTEAGHVRRAWAVRIAAEVVSIVETFVQGVSGKLTRLMDEAVNLSDAVLKRAWSVRAIAESLGLGEVGARRGRWVRVLSESVSLMEGFVRSAVTGIVKLLAETVGVVSAGVWRGRAVRTVPDVTGVAEGKTRRAWSVRPAPEPVAAVETLPRRMWSIRQWAGAVHLVEVGRVTHGFTKVLNETVGILGYWTRYLWLHIFRVKVELSSPVCTVYNAASGVCAATALSSPVCTTVERESTIWD